jgi:hypothetical protein
VTVQVNSLSEFGGKIHLVLNMVAFEGHVSVLVGFVQTYFIEPPGLLSVRQSREKNGKHVPGVSCTHFKTPLSESPCE